MLIHKKIIEIVKQVKPLFLDREGSSKIKVKGVADFVTQIDFKVQAQVKTALYELYPEIQFMGEEKDNSDIDFDGDVWILDPVDGTTNLIHDFRNSTLSLALAGKGVLTLGIIYHPYSDEIFVAERGKGALLNGSPISVSKRQNFSECLISIGTSPYYRELAKENFRIFEKVFTDCADIRRLWFRGIRTCLCGGRKNRCILRTQFKTLGLCSRNTACGRSGWKSHGL